MTLELFAFVEEKKTIETSKAITKDTNNTYTLAPVSVVDSPPVFRQLPWKAYTNSVSTQNNIVSLCLKSIGDNVDNLDSFMYVDVENPVLLDESNMGNYGFSIYSKITNKDKNITAYYRGGTPNLVSSTKLSNIIDNTPSEYALDVIWDDANADNGCMLAIEFKLPPICYSSNSFDSMKIGVRCRQLGQYRHFISDSSALMGFYVGAKRFFGKNISLIQTYNSIVDKNGYNDLVEYMTTYAGMTYNSIPNEYINVGSDTDSFYELTNNVSTIINQTSSDQANYPTRNIDLIDGKSYQIYPVTGYNNNQFTLNVDEKILPSIKSMVFAIHGYQGGMQYCKFEVTELCIILQKSISIKSELYSCIKGRVFGSSATQTQKEWDGRRDTGKLIEDPVDVLEHFKRLTKDGQGYEATPNILMDTGIYGSFDHVQYLEDLRKRKVGFQILSSDKATLSTIVRDLCETYFMVNYQNYAGAECVKPLVNNTFLAKEDTITNEELIDLSWVIGDIGDIIEPETDIIYCEPMINYNYNYATEKYDGFISINNVHKNEYDATCSVGLSYDDGNDLWILYNKLYQKYGVINKPPSNVSDKYMIRNHKDAVWYLKQLYAAMTIRRLSFTVPYCIGRTWDLMTHLKVKFPHITGTNSVEVAIESITKDKYSQKVDVKVMIME